ncbi:efflux RND transporter periplasmic adaptor subunit [Cruoricaptor ignavus]|nr:efflux RND transporter periplasmic adaptor subunit [Cruoricaptor ignavus]
MKMKNFIIAFLALATLFSCKQTEEKAQEQSAISADGNQITLTELQKKNAGIEVATLENQDIAHKILLNGTIDVPPQSMASVSSQLGGIVKSANFLPGNFVKRGQTLAVIENPEMVQMQQDYLQAKANHNLARQNAERQSYLSKHQAVSAKQAQIAQTEAQTQNIAVQGLAARLSAIGVNPNSVSSGSIQRTMAVRSPISGYISKVNTNVGQYAAPAEILFEVVNTDHLHLALKVFEKDLSKISVGQRIYAFTNDNPEKKYPAEIKVISKDFDADKSVMIYAHFLEKDPALIPGTFMNAEVETDMHQGLAVPDDAVVSWEGRQYIFEEVAQNTYRMFPVSIGNSENGFTQLVNFDVNNASKKFVTKGAYQLLMALKNEEE